VRKGPAVTQTPNRYDVTIAGAGAVGLALACALADALGDGAKIAVLDRRDFADPASVRDIRAWAISAGSKRLLDTLGAWAELAPCSQAVTAVDITDSSLGDAFRPVLVTYDNRIEADEPATYIVEAERLNDVLLRAAASRSAIELIGTTAIQRSECGEHGQDVHLENGAVLRTTLLVGADGRNSTVREAAGIKVVRASYPQVGIVTMVRHDKPHGGRAVQHFLPAGPFAILPLTGDRSCITWTEDADRGRAIIALDEAGFLAEVEKRFGYRLGQIELAGPRASWPLDMHLARAFVADRLALVGDAAHGVHPIAGQGLNLGLRDVAALTEVVVDAARLGLDLGSLSVLERYERWRRVDSALSAGAFDALNTLFSNDFSVARSARSLGLAMVNRTLALKEFFVTEAAGLTGEIPKLLRGQMP
jgi:2-octaprenyl-6-methoxyphenol hydroxylase